jgi:hypothetical protein
MTPSNSYRSILLSIYSINKFILIHWTNHLTKNKMIPSQHARKGVKNEDPNQIGWNCRRLVLPQPSI